MARTLVLDVEGWTSHRPGQHVDVRLTAEDGYTAVRSYSIASSSFRASPQRGDLQITVDRLDDGEVSPYLVDEVKPGDMFEVRGPAGGWFVWNPQPDATDRPVQLIGGGSGVVPLMAMIRSHGDAGSAAPFRLLYSVRSPELALFRDELAQRERDDAALDITWGYSRSAPAGWHRQPGRLDASTVTGSVFPPEIGAATFVCGSTPFVENVANWLVDGGHDASHIRTERFGGIGAST